MTDAWTFRGEYTHNVNFLSVKLTLLIRRVLLWCASSVVLYNLGLSRIGDYIGSENSHLKYLMDGRRCGRIYRYLNILETIERFPGGFKSIKRALCQGLWL